MSQDKVLTALVNPQDSMAWLPSLFLQRQQQNCQQSAGTDAHSPHPYLPHVHTHAQHQAKGWHVRSGK